MFGDLFKPRKTDYEKLSSDLWDAKQQETKDMTTIPSVKFSVGPEPDGDGALIVFTDTNGMNTTITMSPHGVRLLIDLLKVVVPDDSED